MEREEINHYNQLIWKHQYDKFIDDEVEYTVFNYGVFHLHLKKELLDKDESDVQDEYIFIPDLWWDSSIELNELNQINYYNSDVLTELDVINLINLIVRLSDKKLKQGEQCQKESTKLKISLPKSLKAFGNC